MATWPIIHPDRTGVWPFRDGEYMAKRERMCPGCRSFRDSHDFGSTCALLDDSRAEAKRLLEEGAKEAYDFCSLQGQQLDNVKHMKFFIELFANWLYEGGSDK